MKITKRNGEFEVILSETFIITKDNPTLTLSAEDNLFTLKLNFDTTSKPDKDGVILAQGKTKVDDGVFNVNLSNFFHVPSAVNSNGYTKFFRRGEKEGKVTNITNYYFLFASKITTNSNGAILLTMNIAKTEETETSEE